MGLSLMHGATGVDEGVVAHVQWGDGLACEVSDLITDLVMKICDEATLFTVQGIKGNKICILVITVMREV